MTIGRGRHGENISNNRILLKRWMVTEMRWKRKADSLSSPETDEMRRPRVLIKSTAELFMAPRFSTAIGWKQ